MRELAILAVASFAVCAACLGGAAALEGHNSGWGIGGFDVPRCDFVPNGRAATRQIKWDESDSAGIAVPASVHYRRGEGDQLVVTGDSAVVPHVRIVDGSVQFDCRSRGFKDVHLDVTLPGRVFRNFSLAGRGDMDLQNIDQPDLSLHLAGAGNIAASGKTDRLDVHVAGAGDIKLGELAVDRVALHVAGSSNVDIAPKDDLDAHIVGSGMVTLHSEPRSIETHIVGSGRIIHAQGPVSGRNHA